MKSLAQSDICIAFRARQWANACWLSVWLGLPVALCTQTAAGCQLPSAQSVENKAPAQATLPESLTIQKVFHVTGIPKVSRNTRGELQLTGGELIFRKGRRELLRLPLQRLQRVQLLAGARDNPGVAIAAAAATNGIGGLLMLWQSKVDTLLFDYDNENGGLMGLALQVPKNQGKRCQEWPARFGVRVEEPLATVAPAKK